MKKRPKSLYVMNFQTTETRYLPFIRQRVKTYNELPFIRQRVKTYNELPFIRQRVKTYNELPFIRQRMRHIRSCL